MLRHDFPAPSPGRSCGQPRSRTAARFRPAIHQISHEIAAFADGNPGRFASRQVRRQEAQIASTGLAARRRVTALLDIRTTAPRRLFRISPDIGPWKHEFLRAARRQARGEPELAEKQVMVVLDALAHDSPVSPDRGKMALVLAVLEDIRKAGGTIELIDSEVHASWPDWSGAEGRMLARAALEEASQWAAVAPAVLRRVAPLFASGWTASDVRSFLLDGSFQLVPVDHPHPSGASYKEAFSVALRLWSMPYRGREGRLKRYVLIGTHPTVSPLPTVVGLIEMGDDAPFNSHRDAFAGARVDELLQWMQRTCSPQESARTIAQHMRALRAAIRPIAGVEPRQAASEILASEDMFTARAGGRSQSARDLTEKKRIAYLLRLAHGERALGALADGASHAEVERSLREGVRAVHDLVLPRIHLEATVCGAVPPFAGGLGGKLVASYLGHPSIVDLGSSSRGSIVNEIFSGDVKALLPNDGLLLVTTKGLYQGHSALYNRARIPGSTGPIPLKKIGETAGETSTLFSPRTGKLAHFVVADEGGPQAKVSRVYGSGGAKRHRALETAMVRAGLHQALVHAGIRRPIYGIRLASNIEEILWKGVAPTWRVGYRRDADAYNDAAHDQWRARWASAVERRVAALEPRDVLSDLASRSGEVA